MQGDNQANVIQENTQSKSGDNFLTILLSILLLIAVSIAGFFAYQVRSLTNELLEFRNQNLEKQTPTPEPESTFPMYTEPSSIPSDWKTFKNEEYGFSFKYPSIYKLYESKGYLNIISPLLPATKGYTLRDGELKMEIYINPVSMNDSLEKYATEIKDTSQRGVMTEEKIEISGVDVVHFGFEDVYSGDIYIFLNNNFRVQIAKYPKVTSRQGEFDQILSTFKFID